jgi:hypothetical protein
MGQDRERIGPRRIEPVAHGEVFPQHHIAPLEARADQIRRAFPHLDRIALADNFGILQGVPRAQFQ